jgi:ABC-type bacteriocin/lantibiotic exporter with double-glycine peptidase domain
MLGFPLFLGAQTPVTSSAKTVSPKDLSHETIQLKVPFVKQEAPEDCGLAVLKMVFAYYGQTMKEAQLDWVKKNTQPEEGTAAVDLMTVFKAAGFETALYPGTLDGESTGLFLQLNKRRPVIVMITSADGKNSHYDVLVGYDPIRHYIILLDPALGQVIVRQKDFEVAWKRANHFTLLALPQDKVPPTPTPGGASILR